MKLIPSRQTFLKLSANSKRTPVLGEAQVKNVSPALLYQHLYSDASASFLFESGKGPDTIARYSFMGEANAKCIQIKNGEAKFQRDGTYETFNDESWENLECFRFEKDTLSVDYISHFWGGWVGYVGYEVAGWLEKLQLRSKDDLGIPDIYFFQVDRLLVYDHQKSLLKYIVASVPGPDLEKSYDEIVHEIEVQWEKIERALARSEDPVDPPPTTNASGPSKIKSNVSQEQYISMVKRAQIYIEEGDIYQANLSQRFEMDCFRDSFELYKYLRKVNPSPFSGFMKWDDLGIISSSPERLVKLERGCLETRPIAGTRPRGNTAQEDQKLSAELLLNEKEKAEHLMLIDLERNDMGRICEYGTVHVTDFMFLEQYSHVSHIVSNIQGTLRPGIQPVDILKALFPGGTITGCPKIRCMEIIDELEPSSRGPYSGSMGYIGFSDFMDLNIIIRTLLVKNGKAYFHVGAGIVADSDPEKEYQETMDKAAALICVLEAQ